MLGQETEKRRAFITASQAITRAWKQMVETGETKYYFGLSKETIDEIMSGKTNPHQHPHTKEYLENLGKLLATAK